MTTAPRHEVELLRALLAIRAGMIGPEAVLDAWDAFTSGELNRFAPVIPRLDPAQEQLLTDLTRDELALRRDNARQAIAALLREPLLGEAQARLDTPEFRAWLRGEALDRRQSAPEAGLEGSSGSIPALPAPGQMGKPRRRVAPASSAGTGPGDEIETATRLRVVRQMSMGLRTEVLLAHDLELDRPVVVRILNPGPSGEEDVRSDFLREAELVGRLEHPGIPPIYRLGFLPDGRPYYTTGSISAEPLEEAIDRFRNPPQPRPGREALSELRGLIGRYVDACRALAYAHGRGMVHCGLAPDSIVVGQGGETLVVEWGQALTGVGSARARGPRRALSDDDLGPLLAYMAPEQLDGERDRIGPAADVYAMGALLYLALTGRPPFEADDPQALRERIRAGKFLRPRHQSRRVSRALEAICLKAMSRRPEHRYSSMRLLALDLERWRTGEPVSVYREPARTRIGKVIGRYPLTAAAAGLIGIVAAGVSVHLGDRALLEEHDRVARAEGLAEAVATADLREVKGLLDRLGADRALALPRLRALADAPDASDRTRRQAALALLADEPGRIDAIVKAMLAPEAAPEDVLVFRHALDSHGLEPGLVERLWANPALSASPLGASGLRTAAALAGFAPQDARWEALGARIADALLREAATAEPHWTAAFEPVADRLGPPLLDAFRDPARTPQARQAAYRYALQLAIRNTNPFQPEELAEILCDADPAQFREALSHIRDRSRAAIHLAAKLERPPGEDDDAGRRRGQVAAALLVLEVGDQVWPLLRHSADPTVRVEILSRFAELGGSPAVLIEKLQEAAAVADSTPDPSLPVEPEDPGVVQALFLALGKFDPASLSEAARAKVRDVASAFHKSHGDPGVHSAVDWLCRAAWKHPEWLTPNPAAREVHPLRGWVDGPEGLTLSIVRGPVTAQLGSPGEEVGREAGETLHQVKIDRRFAVSTTEVSIRAFRRFLEEDGRGKITDYSRGSQAQLTMPSDDCPYLGATWYEAARFCNWLSRRDGLPPSQWCYPAEFGPGVAVPSDVVFKRGYRLPTEAEWTFAARAGNLAPYATGQTARRLDSAAWFAGDSSNRSHPAGQLFPNALGLFDASGNAAEWTHTAFRPYVIERLGASGTDLVREAPPGSAEPGEPETTRVVRGGGWNDDPVDLRLAARRAQPPTSRAVALGFRVARTLP